MPEHKSHHYVPQFFMRLFSTDARRIGVFVINRRKFIRNAPIRGQACRDYFYGRNPNTERAFGSIEQQAAAIIADAIRSHRLPAPGSEAHEQLIFFLGIQHSRTLRAAEQHNEGSEKAVKAMMRRQAELEGNDYMLESVDKVRIRRTNSASEVVRYATIGANLLTDLKFVLVHNESDTPFIASDAPVTLQNRLYEAQRFSVTGYANVGLQLILPLGPWLLLMGYDEAAYDVRRDADQTVRVQNSADVRLLNDLQWEAAHAVLLTSPDTPEAELHSRATHWLECRKTERVVFQEEIVSQSATEVRTRQGGGQSPSAILLDLSFIGTRLPAPPRLDPFEVPPFRDPERVMQTDRAFERLDALDESWRR